MSDESVLAIGKVERIGTSTAILTHVPRDKEKVKITREVLEHSAAIRMILEILTHPQHGVIKGASDIRAVGHRVVHGGEKISESVLITSEIKEVIREYIDLAPLHNPHNLAGINAAESLLPGVPQVAVFDTAFHQTMPAYAFIYGLPYVFYKKYGIRRYGFHGTSHRFVTRRMAELMGKPYDELKLISCHLGNGASMTAVKNGSSIDTSMGFTPLEGLVMGTRCGDIDPAIIPYIVNKEELTVAEVNSMMNKHSGLMGISGISNDMQEIDAEYRENNKRAKLAMEIFTYRVKKYIGAYVAAMGGLDALAFTAGIGENEATVRQMSCQGLECLGIKLNLSKNEKVRAVETEISTSDSQVKVFVIPTNEELLIARDTVEVIKAQSAELGGMPEEVTFSMPSS